ncbi:MAG: hypothetical protein J6T15_02445 [Bacilli bacterium]|nr:hypothetical protein [Bacilli bacterium]
MKSFKLLLLLGLLTVTGCEKEEVKDNASNQETPATTEVTRDEPKEENNVTVTPSDNTEETNNTQSSNDNEENNDSNENVEDNNNTTENNENGEENTNTENNENTEESNNSDEGNTSTEENEITYTVNFYNSSCKTLSTEKINDGLKEYVNETLKTSFVTEIKNTSCQMSNDIPTKGEHVLIIGASSTSGSLEMFFSTVIKKFTITVQTYIKSYTETWNNNNFVKNVDPNSILAVTGDASVPVSFIDLTAENEEPIEKTVEFNDFNCNKLHMYTTNDINGRVFVKEIKFVL